MTVIAFRPPRDRGSTRSTTAPAGPAEILFFTGVRYEKLDAPEARMKRRSSGKPRRSRKAS